MGDTLNRLIAHATADDGQIELSATALKQIAAIVDALEQCAGLIDELRSCRDADDMRRTVGANNRNLTRLHADVERALGQDFAR